ncbi:hypothetical protein P692DRAFT_201810151 [Suillus brevipes Sb2]|nr:hypothetical protein P692DRAFT_201810151 [Suillus brevipes Sb2]
MEMADRATHARIDAVEQDFDSRITSMRAEFAAVQLSFNQTVEVVTGLSNLVEKLRQDRSMFNPSFPPPMLGSAGGSTATAMGVRYLPGVFGPSVVPTSAAVGQTSASRLGRPDVQGSTFTSGQPSSESVQAGPSSAPAVQGDLGVVATDSTPDSTPDSSPASVTNSLP